MDYEGAERIAVTIYGLFQCGLFQYDSPIRPKATPVFITVHTPYTGQKLEITARLTELGYMRSDDPDENALVSPVAAVQGKERKIVLFSMLRKQTRRRTLDLFCSRKTCVVCYSSSSHM